ncbi:MAG: AAA family ATPase [Oscillospiraceae bacterium]|nr:AAA family ATPase [Oscillospiraceae bacterium]
MIKKVKLQNFKRFKNEKIELHELGTTLMVGGNNSGKTSLIQALSIWEFCKMFLEHEGGKNALIKDVFAKRQGKGIGVDEFLPVALPSLNHLWTNLSSKQIDDEYPSYTLRIACVWDSESKKNQELEFGLLLANDRLFIRVTNSTLSEGDKIPRVVYLPTFAGVLSKENLITPAERLALTGKGLAGSIIRNMIHDLYQQDLKIQADCKGNSQRFRGKAREKWLNSSPYQKLQKSLREVFSLELVVGTFNPTYQTVIRVNVRRVEQSENGDFVPMPQTKYALRDIMAMGSGFLQWVNIYCVLLGQDIDTLVLDEPDAHLHATLQSELLNRITSISREMNKQIMIATHSSEMIKNAVLSSIFWVEQKKYLSEEKSRTKIMNGIGVEYSPRLFGLQKHKRVLFVENESDYTILSIFSKTLKLPLISDVEIWATTDNHDKIVKLFYILSDEIPALKAIQIKDRDLISINSVDERLNFTGIENSNSDILSLMWKRRNIESYLLNPNAIARASKNKVSPEEVIHYFRKKHGLSIENDGVYLEGLPEGIQISDGKKMYEMPDGIEKTFGCNKYDVAKQIIAEEVSNDIRIFIERFNNHFSFSPL